MPLNPDMLVKTPTGIWRVDASGRWYPNICGAATDEEDNETEDEPDETEDKPQTFTQRQVNKIMAKEKREGKAAALREAMELLGADSLEDAKALLDEARERDTKAEDDAAKRLKKAQERELKADVRLREATLKANSADVLSSLIGEGMPKAKAVRAVKMVDLDLTAEDLTEDEIVEAVETLKEEMPELFGESEKVEKVEEWRPVGSPDSTARGGQRRRPQTQTNAEKAKELLAKRHPQFANKT